MYLEKYKCVKSEPEEMIVTIPADLWCNVQECTMYIVEEILKHCSKKHELLQLLLNFNIQSIIL